MPIQGKFYSSKELQEILGVTRQRVHKISQYYEWQRLTYGLYWAEDVEPYLIRRGINPLLLSLKTRECNKKIAELVENS